MEMVTPRIDVLEDGANYGKFVVEPLGQGFGFTIGNALRRVLLASIPGAAITSIKIDGVLHEFSTIPGVMEDTTELILNLRELFVQMDTEIDFGDEPIVVTIDVHGPGEITGADIQCPAGISIANPELHIATLDSETAVLRAELSVEMGKGYVLPEKQERVKQSIGVIPVGAVFTPVLKVAYTVDPTRVGHKTDFDRMVLEVTTNGTVRPSDAVSDAAKILDTQLRLFFDFAREPRRRIGDNEYRPISPGAPDARIEELDFSVRTYNCLKKANVLTIRELVQYSEVDLMNIRNFGKKSLDEIVKKLGDMNLALRPTGPGEVRIVHQDVDVDDKDSIDDAEELNEVLTSDQDDNVKVKDSGETTAEELMEVITANQEDNEKDEDSDDTSEELDESK